MKKKLITLLLVLIVIYIFFNLSMFLIGSNFVPSFSVEERKIEHRSLDSEEYLNWIQFQSPWGKPEVTHFPNWNKVGFKFSNENAILIQYDAPLAYEEQWGISNLYTFLYGNDSKFLYRKDTILAHNNQFKILGNPFMKLKQNFLRHTSLDTFYGAESVNIYHLEPLDYKIIQFEKTSSTWLEVYASEGHRYAILITGDYSQDDIDVILASLKLSR